MNELPRMFGWVVDQLTDEPGLLATAPAGVYAEAVPAGISDDLVAVTVQHQAPSDDVRQRGYRVMARALFVVKASVAGESYTPLEPAADRIDSALHNQRGAAADGLWVEAVRLSPIAYPEVAGAKQFRHLGGLYRLLAHTT